MRLNFPVSESEKIYIEMCNQSSPLQKLWRPKIGDLCIDQGDLWYIHDDNRLNYVKAFIGKDTWLPTEEQLQGLLFAPTMENPVDLLFRFSEWCRRFRNYTSPERKFTIKQLWLCYFMEYLHGMIWGNDEWHKR